MVTTKWNSSELIKPIIKPRKMRGRSVRRILAAHAADYRHRLEQQLCRRSGGKLVIADRFLFTGLARDVARFDLDWVLKLYAAVAPICFYFGVARHLGPASHRHADRTTTNPP